MSPRRVFSWPRSRKSRCEVLTISWRSLAFLRSRRPGTSELAAVAGDASVGFRKLCRLRSLADRSTEDSRDLLLARPISEGTPRSHARLNYDGHSNILVTHVKLRAVERQQVPKKQRPAIVRPVSRAGPRPLGSRFQGIVFP